MMTTIELMKKIEELKELEAIVREAEEEIEAIKDEIKAEMQSKEEMKCGRYCIKYKNVSSNRFDTTTFKTACPDIYKLYVKQTVSRRFTITG
jgi:predicted phage-related endonuclease